MTASDLPVPDEAVQALTDARKRDNVQDVVRAIAAPVVAAELRAEADRIEDLFASTGKGDYIRGAKQAARSISTRLRARADELSPVVVPGEGGEEET